tara:strand:+ start:14898 stop:15308 length:411 start_codon:yes stop_codon:yes gene_type:complete
MERGQMARKKLSSLTDLELDVMNVVWRLNRATVRQIVEALQSFRPLAYTTVQTVLSILTEKKVVEYTCEGRAYVYSAIVQPEGVRKETVKALVDKLFSGSSQSLVLHLIESDSVTTEEAEQLRHLLDQIVSGDAGD